MLPYCITILIIILIINKRLSVDDVVLFIQNHKYMIKTACVTKKPITLYKLRNFYEYNLDISKQFLLFPTKFKLSISFDLAKSGLS